MSRRTIASSSSNRCRASARASSVLPTPVGPRNRNEPMGRRGSLRPARARRIASLVAWTASSWPTTRSCRRVSISSSLRLSPSSHPPSRAPVPLLAQPVAAVFELDNLLFQRGQAVAARGVIFLLQRLTLDLQLHDPPVDLIELDRLAVDLHAQPAGRLIDEIDRLVGEEPATDVPVRQRRRRDDGGIGDAHAVVHFVALLQPAQD